ncbi:MAG TPA: hypothetical protein VD997_13270 [Phycisphaerales bacterium]|nr:hypothetical protein [Phycisphaerales bacterium]
MQPRCKSCGYSLAALSAGPCPECGTPFDPADPSTLYHPAQSLMACVALRPARWLLVLHGLVALPYTLMLDSPSRLKDEELLPLDLLVIFFPALAWMLGFVPHLGGRWLLRARHIPRPRWSKRWLVTPALIACIITAHRQNLVWNVRWWIARPALERYIADPAAAPARIAGYEVVEIERLEGGATVLHLGWPDTLYSDGHPQLIHIPQGAPDPKRTFPFGARYPVPRNADLGHDWYAWVDET